ncbi:putative kelch-like protein 14 [Apostichopus japonicus]|uniref:Putative kelch-like protein 14 n=1 Tax=Stichopus japonicus TaxID=307972 RepID=A0A2G8JLC2_STIJA|nr:putative kelch-like protein 14 [Apostichopus japonicus]
MDSSTIKKTTPDQKMQCLEHAPDLLHGLHQLWKQRILCDCTVLVGSYHISVQKVVLASCSEYFRTIFTESEDVKEVKLNGQLTQDGLDLVLEYMYTSKIVLTLGNIKRVLNTALQLRMPKLTGLCARYLIKMVNLENCVPILQLSNTFQLTEFQHLKAHAQDFIADNLVEVSEMTTFQKLTADELSQILSQDRVGTTSEFQLFKIAAKWITYDKAGRELHAPTIIKHIRFPLIKSKDLVDHVQSYDFMLEQEESHHFLLQALNYHLIPQRQHSFQIPRNRFRSSNDVAVAVGVNFPIRRSVGRF